jgi:hypothetical protein
MSKVGEGHRVADHHDVAPVRVDDRPPADVVRGVGDHREGERRSGRRVDVLADLAHTPLDLALDLGRQLGAPPGVDSRLGQLLEGEAGDPLGVHREELAARQPEGELDHLASDPDVALQHLGRQVAQRFLEDVLAGGASGRAAGDDVLEPAQARAGLLLDGLASREGGAEAFDDRLCLGEALPELGRLGFLGLAAHREAALQVGDLEQLG